MRQLPFRIIQSFLCIVTGALIAVIEIAFFPGVSILSLPFFGILIVTVLAVFLYVRAVNSYIFIFLYTICLYSVLEISDNSADIVLLLACLFALALLFANARFRRSADRSGTKKPAYGGNLLTVFICAAIVVFSTFQLYVYVLQPHLTRSDDLVLPDIIETLEEPNTAPPPQSVDQNNQADSDQLYNTTPLRPPQEPDVLKPVLTACGVIVCILAAFVLYRYGRYRKWVRETLAAPPEKQIKELYMFFLRSLAVCGFPRKICETPYEYLDNTETDGFPLPPTQFKEATDAFAASQFGGKAIAPEARDNCVSLFSALPALVKAQKGRRFYYLHYIRKAYV